MIANGLKVNFTKMHEDAIVPTYAKEGDCCCDLYSTEEVTIPRFGRVLVDTGIAVEIPEGFEVQIRPRSGNAWKYGITVLNSPGTVDQGYLNSLKVILINLGEDSYTIKKGDRIAQAKFSPYYTAYFFEVDKLSETERGLNGLGSTGK